ncbi:YagK/YfjJ domain-containing protein [Photorhabdus aegyptia]|uniref:YagK/YfjJ domain-containing protein n=1 Tax=Photorhabdus aegyptia TaxID=2805098 RepID=UPI00092F9968|nr:inovirus-type Gp2 protein [Photorhabdus aegyptia]MCC8457183.1 inovirus-type Gp2 protein [Photorhabdus aegyptia]
MKSPYELTEKEFELLLKTAERKYDSPIERYILRKSLSVVYNILEHHNRIFAFRADLRFAEDHVPDDPDSPVCWQQVDPQAITRCIESMKSHLGRRHQKNLSLYTHLLIHPLVPFITQ